MARGSIAARNGGYQARVDGPIDPRTGRRRQFSRQCRTKTEAQTWITEQLHLLATGTHLEPSTVTVAAYLDEWLEMRRSNGARQITLDQYASLIRAHILPCLGAHKLQKLGPLHVARLVADIRAKGRSDSTVNHTYRIIRQALKDANALGLVRENVAVRVPTPRVARREMRVWSREQARTFLDAAEGSPLCLLWHMALATGMRRGELMGLRWADIDLDGGELSVRQASVYTSKGRERGRPKTPGSVRTMSLQPEIVARLRAHRLAQLQERMVKREVWVDRDLVFAGEMGNGLWEGSIRQAFLAAIAHAGVPRIRIHDLRHTFATLSLLAGQPVHLVAKRLGHANPAITLRTYAHVLPSSDRELAACVGGLLYG